MSCCEECFGAAESAQAELSPVFQAVEHAFHDVSCFVKVGVIIELNFAVLSGRNARDCVRFVQPVTQMIGVITTVRDNCAAFADIGLKALAGMRNIRPVARCQAQMDRAATAITDQMQLRIQPAFGFANAAPVAGVFLTPFAAIRWVLTWLASIMSVERSAASCARASNTRSKTPASDQRL